MDKIRSIIDFIGTHSEAGASLRLDSRQVRRGDVFFAVRGVMSDGRNFIRNAEANGASCVVSQAGNTVGTALPVLEVENLRELLPAVASAYYGAPSESLFGIGVTGTNGKTTVTHWIAQLLTQTGKPCAVVGTLGCRFKDEKLPVPALTTPDILSLEDTFSLLRKKGARAFAMEASSIGLEQGRMNGLNLKTAVFTNLSQDHLDYHKTMTKYRQAKEILFSWPGLQTAVVNLDDPAAEFFCARAKAAGANVIGYSRKRKCDLYASDGSMTSSGMKFNLHWKNAIGCVKVGFIGLFNIENFLAAAGAALSAGVCLEDLCRLASGLRPPAGRMQLVEGSVHPLVVVDYAHTPDALAKAMGSLERSKKHRGGELWVVVGAGGDRDSSKRPLMGQAAGKAEHAVLTSDNPRTEDPRDILDQVAKGAPGAVRILDRAEAIEYAVLNAKPDDIILVAGKGHEDYQEICGVKHHFSDVEQVEKALALRKEKLNA